MKKYLENYPDQQSDINALVFAFGEDKAEEIANEALRKGKKIELIIDEEIIDSLDYKLV